MSAYCSICDDVIPTQRQTLQNSVYALNFTLGGEKCYGKLRDTARSFQTTKNGKNINFQLFSSFDCDVTPVEDARSSRKASTDNTDKNTE